MYTGVNVFLSEMLYMKKNAFVLIILAGILWGTSGIFVHFLSPMGFSSLQMACMRGCVAAICMSVYAFLSDRKLFKVCKEELLLSVGSGISMFVAGASYYASIQASSVSTAVVLMYTAPVMVMAYSVAFMGEKLTKLKTLSVVLMVIGCGLVSGIIGGMKFGFAGIALGLLAGVGYSSYNIFTKYQMRKNFNPVSSSMYCFIVMSILALIFSKPAELVSIASQNWAVSVPMIIGIGICTSVLPYFFYTVSLKSLPVGTAAALGIIEPMAATIFSVALLGEKLSVQSFMGIVLIIGSVFLLSRSED